MYLNLLGADSLHEARHRGVCSMDLWRLRRMLLSQSSRRPWRAGLQQLTFGLTRCAWTMWVCRNVIVHGALYSYGCMKQVDVSMLFALSCLQ